MTNHRRVLVPIALAALAQLFAVPAALADNGAPAPAARRFDGSLPRPFMMSMRGANATEAWVTMNGRASNHIDEAVVDLQTGCVVETMAPFGLSSRFGAARPDPFSRGAAADSTKKAEAVLADAATKTELVRFVAAGRRFGQRRLGFGTIGNDDVAFSSDGKTIVVEASEAAFRSRDGGQTFDRLDANMSRSPSVTADGKWIFYERCSDASRRNQSCPEGSREVRVVAADDSTPARTVAIGSGLLRGLDPTGQKLVVVRYDLGAEVTVMHVDPTTATIARAFAVPSTVVKKNRFHDIDPSKSGYFGVFDDNDNPPFNVITVISMTDGKLAQKLTVRNEMATETDEESGRVMWQTFPDDHSWARRPGGVVKDLGMGDPLGWAPGGRALVFAATYAKGARVEEPPATLGAVACKLVRVSVP